MRNTAAHAPTYSYVLLAVLSILSFILFFTAMLVLKISAPYSYVLASLIILFLGFMFALVWPVGLWRWGILASSGFWLYLIAVFVSSLSHQNIEWLTIVEALAFIAIATFGADVGRRISSRRRPARTS